MRSEKVTLPAFLASALINGDVSGLEPDDLHWVEAAEKYCSPGCIVSCGEESFFASWCELPGFHLAADMLEYVVLYQTEEE